MKLLIENKKIFVIITFVLLCGIILNFSRSSLVLKSAQNNETLPFTIDPKAAQFSGEATDAPYCILYTDDTIRLKNNVQKTLDYLQLHYTVMNITNTPAHYTACESVLFATSSLSLLGSVEEIERYVFNGGKLFLLQTLQPDGHFQILAPAMGITSHDGYGIVNELHMTSNLLLGAEGKTFLSTLLEDSSLNISVNEQVKLYMTSKQKKPLLWRSSFGEGRIMTLNANILSEKVSRGILTGMLSQMDDTFIYPILNTKTFYIDDFPAPIAQGRNDIIYNEFRKDLSDFYRNIWWSDMLRVANTTNIFYTGAIIQSYNDSVTPPFEETDDDDRSTLVTYGREMIQGNGEIGIHGYNHQSLTLDEEISKTFGYNHWQSTAHMKEALTELRTYIAEAFPAYDITSYVPPSNVLSEEGRAMLKAAIPTMKVIASLYTEDDTNRSYVQEFDIGEDGIVNMPRISSGYFRNDTNEWEIANALTTHGVFSHFIHPDDVISKDRSNGGWGDMLEEFEKFMHDLHSRYAWLRPLSATKAAYYQAATLQSRITIDETPEEINGTIEEFTMPQHFILRTTKRIKSQQQCTVELIEPNTYLVVATEASFTIELEGDAS